MTRCFDTDRFPSRVPVAELFSHEEYVELAFSLYNPQGTYIVWPLPT